MRSLSILGVVALLIACDGGRAPVLTDEDAGVDAGGADDAGMTDAGVDAGQPAPVTTANPPGETHVGALSVTLTSTPAATIKYTTDGSDPATSGTATSGASPVVVTLEAPAQITLRFFAVGTDTNETPHSEQYTLVETLNPASISGKLFVSAAMHTGSAAVLLYNTDPHNGGTNPVAIQSVSPTTGNAAYHFEGLAAGRYWVAGAWWPGTAGGDPSAFGIARTTPVTLDPAIPASARVDFIDVYVGLCDPQDTGVEGVITLASSLQNQTVMVAAYSSPPTPDVLQGSPQGYAVGIGTGTTRTFAMCGINPGSVYVMAGVGPTMAMPGNAAGVYAAYPQNPVSVTHVAHIEFMLGEQDPNLGSISGTIHLNGSLPGGVLNVAATTRPATGQPQVQALIGIDGTGDRNYAYALNNLPAGSYTLTLILKTADTPALEATTQSPTPVTVTGNGEAMRDLTGSVGRVVGTVTVTNPPANAQKVAVVVTPIGSNTPAATTTVTLGTAAGDGSRSSTFSTFGVPDGTFNVVGIVDTNNNGNYLDDLGHSCGGPIPPPHAIISQGNEVTSDLTITLPGVNCP